MASLIEDATIQIRRDSAANWTAQNPILASGEYGKDTTNNVIKNGDGSTAWNDLAVNEVAEKKVFMTYKDRSSSRLEPFGYDNAVSTSGDYALLWGEVSHMFNSAHVAIGDTDLSGSGTSFYPTPPPASYGRSGIPNVNFTETEVSSNLLSFATPTGFRDGTIFRYEVLTGTTITNLVDGTEYYLRRVDASTVSIHATEANAIANTSPIAISGGTGTFRLTQEGIRIKSSSAPLALENNAGTLGAQGVAGSGTDFSIGVVAGDTNDNKLFSGVDESNETRPETYYEFSYIRY